MNKLTLTGLTLLIIGIFTEIFKKITGFYCGFGPTSDDGWVTYNSCNIFESVFVDINFLIYIGSILLIIAFILHKKHKNTAKTKKG